MTTKEVKQASDIYRLAVENAKIKDERDQLRKENDELRAELQAIRDEDWHIKLIGMLRAENAELRKELSKMLKAYEACISRESRLKEERP